MKFEILENGNLRIEADEVADVFLLESWQERPSENLDHSVLSEMLEDTGWQPNGRLYQVLPAQVGALTEAPMLSDNLEIGDAGQVTAVGSIWWYPQYQVSAWYEVLCETGSVEFTRT